MENNALLLDSNVIIYAALPQREELRRFLAKRDFSVSAVSYVEVLGYHQLQTQEKKFLQDFFEATSVLPITQEILDTAVKLKQKRKMTLGDGLIAATAIVHDLLLATRNLQDFVGIKSVRLLDPLA